jgi:teichuronic acid biosynthesis glycosyltransferase TuaG
MKKGNDSTLVSIVIPIRNSAGFIESCCRSVQAQTYTYWEALLIDDASRDRSIEIAMHFVALDPRFRLIRSARSAKDPLGPWLPRNRGLEAAHGQLVAFLDADDLWLPQKLERQLEIMQHAGSDLCTSHYFRFSDSSGYITEMRECPQSISLSLLSLINPIPLSTVLIKRELLQTGFSPTIHEDHEIWQRLFSTGIVRYCCCCEPLVAYRLHSANLTGSWKKKLELRFRFDGKYKRFWRLARLIIFLLIQLSIQLKSVRWRLSRIEIADVGFIYK